MSMDKEKIKNMILFFVNNLGKISSIKLHKGMLLADRMYWALNKKSISGLEYVKAQYGPVMEEAGKEILEEMDNSILSIVPSENHFVENSECAIKVRSTNTVPNMDIFLDEEITFLERACKLIIENSDDELVAMTHDEAWKEAEIGDVLSYEDCIHERMLDHVIELTSDEEKLIKDALENEDYGTVEALAAKWM